MMKIPPLILSLAVLIFAKGIFSETAADVLVGEPREKILERLGTPKGHIGSSNFEVFYFDRGEVVLRDGLVKSHTLVSEQELAWRQEQLEQKRQARAQREQEARELRLQEGRALRARVADDSAFAALPARDRAAFWQVFRQRYPEIDVELDHLVASRQAAVEQAQQAEARRQREAEQRRLTDLERRVEDAERQARLAEQRERSRRDYYVSHYYHPPRSPVVVIPGRSHQNSGSGNDSRSSRASSAEQPAVRSERFPSGLEGRGTFDDRAAARQRALDADWNRRQEAFSSQGGARQGEFEVRRRH